MKCPTCGKEYTSDYNKCADCSLINLVPIEEKIINEVAYTQCPHCKKNIRAIHDICPWCEKENVESNSVKNERKCKKCGSVLDENKMICDECMCYQGIENEVSKKSKREKKISIANEVHIEENTETQQQEKKSQKKILMIIIFSFVSTLLSGLGLYEYGHLYNNGVLLGLFILLVLVSPCVLLVSSIIHIVRKEKKKPFVIKLAACVILGIVFFVSYSNYQGNIRPARHSLQSIQREYERGNYSNALSNIEDFNSRYAGRNRRITANVNQITTSIEDRMYRRVQRHNNTMEDLERYTDEYLRYFPNGRFASQATAYRSQASNWLALDRLAEAREYIRQREWDRARSRLRQVINSDVDERHQTEARTLQSQIDNTFATDFEVIGGSSNVTVLMQRNYSVTCPHCGFRSGAMGTTDIWSRIHNRRHRVGIETLYGYTFMCASAFQGGCRQISFYDLRVRFF